MKREVKRVVSLILTLCMVMSLPGFAWAEEAAAAVEDTTEVQVVSEEQKTVSEETSAQTETAVQTETAAQTKASTQAESAELTVESDSAVSSSEAASESTEPATQAEADESVSGETVIGNETGTESETESEAGTESETEAESETETESEIETESETEMTENKPDDGTTTGQPFASGTGGSTNFRIPAMVTLDDGTIVAAADARWDTTKDGYGLDTIVSRSTDNGATWNYTFANYLGDNGNCFNTSSTAFIDPSLATDGKTVYMLVDLYPGGTVISNAQAGTGYDSSGHLMLKENGSSSYDYYLGDFGSDGTAYIYSYSTGESVADYTVDQWFYVYVRGTRISNLFYSDCAYTVLPTSYLYLTTSTDGGATWSVPTMLNSQVKNSTDSFYGVGPGNALVTSTGRIMFACYTYSNGSDGNTSVIYSDDGGKTWARSADMSAQSSEATMVEADGTIYMFTRHGGYYYSTDNGTTWSSRQTVSGISYTTSCQLNAFVYSEKIDGCTAILLSAPTNGRSTGKIFVGLVQEDGSISWDYTCSVNGSGTYQYSCLAELSDGTVALLYESGSAALTFTTIAIADIASGAAFGSDGTDETEETAEATVTDETTGITATAAGLTSISTSKGEVITNEDGSVSISYDILLNGGEYTGEATLSIPVDEAFSTANCASFTGSVEASEAGEAADFDVTRKAGCLICTVPHFSTITIDGEEAEYTDTVDVTLYVGQSVGYMTYAAETSTDIDSSIATALIGSDAVTYDAQLGEDSSFSGAYTNLENALYTFTESEDGYVICNDATGIYLNLGTAGIPGKTASDTITLTLQSDGVYSIYSSSNERYLVFNANSTYRFDRQTGYASATCGFLLYRAADDGEESSSEIPGYVQVTSLSDISSGSQYLIAAYRNSGYYVLYPSTSTSDYYSHVAKVLGSDSVTETTVTFTGVTAGTTSVVVGDTLYNITVLDAAAYNSVELEGGYTTTLNISDLDSSFSVPVGGSVVWNVEDTDIAAIYETGDTGVSASIIARAKGETIVTAKVYDASGNLTATYYWTVTANSTYGSGSYNFTWTVTEVVYNGTLYYSTDGGELIEATDYVETTDENGNTIRTYTISCTSTDISVTGLLYFVKPDEGYTLTYVYDETGKTYSNFYATSEVKDYYTKSAFLAAHSGVTHNGGWYTDIMTDAEWDVLIAQAIAAGCEGVYWNTRLSLDGNGSYTGSYTNYCNKLPTVDKVISSLTRTVNNTETTITYVDGETDIQVGDVIHYTVTITTYYETVDITYSNAVLTDTMSSGSGAAATFTVTDTNAIENVTSLTVTDYLGNGTTQTAASETAVTYDVTYTVTDADQDVGLVNTVALEYDYSSTYGTGSYGGTASAECKVSVLSTALDPIDIVVDFGLPVTIDYSEDHGRYDLASGTANYGTVTVKDNIVTYTPTKVLADVDTITLVNTMNATYTVSVYPATTVYYEEGFASYGTGWSVASGGSWSGTTAVNYSAEQQMEGVTTDESEKVVTYVDSSGTAANNYNYDGAYAGGTGTSAETSAETTTAKDSLSFTFTGTGVDIFANCTSTSGIVCIMVTSGGSTEKLLIVDMANTGTYNTGDNTTAYNTPIASISGLGYGSHTVTIYLSSARSSGFEFDGFRVYGTLDSTSNENYTTAYAIYTADLEEDPSYYELRDYVLGGIDIDSSSSDYADDIANEVAQVYASSEVDSSASAIVVYDSNVNLLKSTETESESETETESETESVAQTLLDEGPKNELYLYPGSTVVFKINTARQVQIGLRSVTGASVTYTISNGSTTKTYTTSSIVDMFYDLQAKNATGTITYTIAVPAASVGILSITDIKVSDSVEDIFGTLTEEEVVAALTSTTDDSGTITDSGETEEETEETEEETGETEPEVFYAYAELNIYLEDASGETIASTALSEYGVEGETATFSADAILAQAESVLPDGYSIDESTVSEQTVACGECADVTISVNKLAMASLEIQLVDYRKKTVASTSLTSETGVEGAAATFTASEILEAVNASLPDGYAIVNESSITDQTAVYGGSGSISVQIGKVATLQVTFQMYSGLFRTTTVGTAMLTKVQTSSADTATFSASEISAAVPDGYRVLISTSSRVKYGSTATKVLTVYRSSNTNSSSVFRLF